MNAERRTSKGASIQVRAIGRDEPMQFEVVVQDLQGELHYQVTMSHADFQRLAAGNTTPEDCVRAAFSFLLDHEPKELILRQFDVSVIERYFPEFHRQFPRYREERDCVR